MAAHNLLEAAKGFEPQVGTWYTALEGLRSSLYEGVEDLSTETLARRAFAGANTIGTLLIHIAEGELFWIQEVLGGVPLTEEQRQLYRVDVYGRPGADQMEPRDIGHFRKRLDRVRELTHTTVQPLRDADLPALRTWEDPSGEKREFNVHWILNHVAEHEAHHRGQILLLKGALGY